HCRFLERAMGFEPTTLTLARLCSTPELHPHSIDDRRYLGTVPPGAYMPNRQRLCKSLARLRPISAAGLVSDGVPGAKRRLTHAIEIWDICIMSLSGVTTGGTAAPASAWI